MNKQMYLETDANFSLSEAICLLPNQIASHFLVFYFNYAWWHSTCQIFSFPSQESDLCPMHWKLRLSTTGPPEKPPTSQLLYVCFFNAILLKAVMSLNSFIQKLFIEHLLHAKHYSKQCNSSTEQNRQESLMQLIVWWGKINKNVT